MGLAAIGGGSGVVGIGEDSFASADSVTVVLISWFITPVEFALEGRLLGVIICDSPI